MLVPVGLDERDLAEPAGVDDLLAQHPVIPAALLRAGLHDLLRRFDGLDHLRAFGDGVRDRLLDVDVLAGGDGVERDGLVPVIGRADHHRVDLAIVEDAAVVGHLRGRGPGDLGGLQQARLVDVADRHHLVAGQLLQQAHQAAGAAAGADHADADPIVRALRAGRAPSARRARARRQP